MTSIREQIAGEAQIGTVKFWATRATPQATPRRIVQYGGVGVDGAALEDLGEDARVEILNATVTEFVYQDLKAIKTAAEKVTIVHPLFGVFEGRLWDVTYDAGPNDMVDIVCTCIEDGDPADLFITRIDTTASAKQSATSAFDDLGLDDLDGLQDLPTSTGLPAAGTNLTSSWNNFSTVMDDVSQADALFTDVAAAYNELASAGGELIDAIDEFSDATQSMVNLVDSTYELLNTARDYVDAMEKQVSDVWQNLMITTPMSLAEIALELIGDASEETIDIILDRNPTLIDICAVPIGVELSIPVNL